MSLNSDEMTLTIQRITNKRVHDHLNKGAHFESINLKAFFKLQ